MPGGCTADPSTKQNRTRRFAAPLGASDPAEAAAAAEVGAAFLAPRLLRPVGAAAAAADEEDNAEKDNPDEPGAAADDDNDDSVERDGAIDDVADEDAADEAAAEEGALGEDAGAGAGDRNEAAPSSLSTIAPP